MIKMTVQDLQDMVQAQVETVITLRSVTERCEKRDREIVELKTQLRHADDDYETMRKTLDDLRRRPVPITHDDWKTQGAVHQHGLLMQLLHTPQVFVNLAAYMRNAPVGEKIAQIKKVREVTGWGLKEAKDFVESYIPAPVVDCNPCKDSACLNG